MKGKHQQSFAYFYLFAVSLYMKVLGQYLKIIGEALKNFHLSILMSTRAKVGTIELFIETLRNF